MSLNVSALKVAVSPAVQDLLVDSRRAKGGASHFFFFERIVCIAGIPRAFCSRNSLHRIDF